MIPQGGGKIINLGSNFGVIAFEKRSVYAAAKAGVHHLFPGAPRSSGPSRASRLNVVCAVHHRDRVAESNSRAARLQRMGHPKPCLADRTPGISRRTWFGAVLFLSSKLVRHGRGTRADGGWRVDHPLNYFFHSGPDVNWRSTISFGIGGKPGCRRHSQRIISGRIMPPNFLAVQVHAPRVVSRHNPFCVRAFIRAGRFWKNQSRFLVVKPPARTARGWSFRPSQRKTRMGFFLALPARRIRIHKTRPCRFTKLPTLLSTLRKSLGALPRRRRTPAILRRNSIHRCHAARDPSKCCTPC